MKLSLEPDPAPTPVNNTPTVLEGIVRQRCLSATYNRTRMILAPHILYTRHGALYMDASVVSREGMLPREEKMGTFKLDGLKDLAVLEREFAISGLFDASLEKYQGETLMMVEPQVAAAA
ncbi:MAG: WYL domain-containing protein [Sphingomonas sp.]